MIGLLFLLAKIIIVPDDSATTQKGMNGCVSGDTLMNREGTYNENQLRFPAGQKTTWMGESTADKVIINAQHINAVYSRNPWYQTGNDTLIFQDITMRNGYLNVGGAMCLYENKKVTLRRCRFIADTSTISGGVAMCTRVADTIRIENCFFDSCYGYDYAGAGGGVFVFNSGLGLLISVNNTFINCRSVTTGHILGKCTNITFNSWNDIFWYCGPGDSLFQGNTITLTNCNLDTTGTGGTKTNCIKSNPLFNSDYTIPVTSPCKDVGYNISSIITSNLDLWGNVRPNPATNIWDVGCSEYYAPPVMRQEINFSTLEIFYRR